MKHVTTSLRAVRLAIACGASAIGMSAAFGQTIQSTEQATTTKADFVKTLKAQAQQGQLIDPQSLGSFASDTVYTAITPCRLVDTRIAGGRLQAGVARSFDADGTTFTAQGGNGAGCGVPYGIASAVAMSIHVVSPSGGGAVYAWGLGAQPIGSVINYANSQTIATNAIVPIVPGVGNDFTLSAQTSADVAVDAVGYFAAPTATTLDCTNVASAVTAVPYNSYTAVDAVCPATYRVTGGGSYPTEGTLGRPNIWIDGSPTAPNGWRSWVDNQTGSSRTIQTYAVCCRVPGR